MDPDLAKQFEEIANENQGAKIAELVMCGVGLVLFMPNLYGVINENLWMLVILMVEYLLFTITQLVLKLTDAKALWWLFNRLKNYNDETKRHANEVYLLGIAGCLSVLVLTITFFCVVRRDPLHGHTPHEPLEPRFLPINQLRGRM